MRTLMLVRRLYNWLNISSFRRKGKFCFESQVSWEGGRWHFFSYYVKVREGVWKFHSFDLSYKMRRSISDRAGSSDGVQEALKQKEPRGPLMGSVRSVKLTRNDRCVVALIFHGTNSESRSEKKLRRLGRGRVKITTQRWISTKAALMAVFISANLLTRGCNCSIV